MKTGGFSVVLATFQEPTRVSTDIPDSADEVDRQVRGLSTISHKTKDDLERRVRIRNAITLSLDEGQG